MAGGDLSPRQKMIGMMYLVLTALLALNVSKEILDAFVLVNTSLEKSVINYDEKNALLYSDFNLAKSFDPVKVTPYWEKAQQAKQASLELVDYIKELKIKLLQETEKITKNEADTLQLKFVNGKDNYDIPTNILIGQEETGEKGMAKVLKDKITRYKKDMLGLFDLEEQKTLNFDLKTDDVKTDLGMESWEMGNFYHTPLAASITLLSKVQTEVKKVEYDVVSKLLQHAGKKQFNFDTIVTKVIPNSNYVLLGEDYKADVFLAAFSTTQNPEIAIGKYDSINNNLSIVTDTIPVSNGLGQYIVPTTKEGIFSYEGVLKLKTPGGGYDNYPFRSEYIVAKPSLVVSPDKMNVFYIGPDNPVSISVPGIASENIKATITGSGNRITKTGNGKYNVKLSGGSPRSVDVKVSATMANGETRNMGSMTFVVKKLPVPNASIAGISGEADIVKPQLCGFKTIRANYGSDFVFQGLPLSIVSCNVEVFRNGVSIYEDKSIRSMNLSEKTKNFFCNNSKKNDVIYFTAIKARDISGAVVPMSGIRIKVK